MIERIKSLLNNEGAIYFLSSLVYSFSTYLIALLIPYKLNLESMAEFSAVFNIVMLLSFVFELGIVTSFLRHNQIYKVSGYINAFLQLSIFILILIFSKTILGNWLDGLFGLGSVSIAREYIYLSVLSILMWIFFKNNLLAQKKIKLIIYNAFWILFVRVFFLIYIFFYTSKISLNHIYLYLFIIPFIVMLVFLLRDNIKFVFNLKDLIGDKRNINIFRKRLKIFIKFSILTYFIAILYVYTGRYVIVYVTDHQMKQLMAELGYAFSFFGLVLVFITSIRSYLISKFNISDMDAIEKYVKKINSYRYKFFLLSIVISIIMSYIVFLIKPSYLSDRSVVFVFILILSYVLIAYYSLITLLSKTFNFNQLELILNIIRLILVILSVHLIFVKYPIGGFIILNISMVAIEYIFARIVLKRVQRSL